MAGTNSSFNAKTFRDAMKVAMDMGAPSSIQHRATFHFASTKVYPPDTALDAEGNPFDPNIAAIVSTPAPVQVPCAVEFAPASTASGLNESAVGSFRKSSITLTIVDEYYDSIKDAIEVSVGGDRYIISYLQPPVGLFDVTIYALVCVAKDEK